MTIQFDDIDGVASRDVSEGGARLVIRRLDNNKPVLAKNGKEIAIILQGPDSQTFRRAVRAQAIRRMQGDGLSPKDITEATLEQVETETFETLVACSIGWENVLDTNGDPIEFSKDAVRALYTRWPAVREQAERFYGDRRNFLAGSSND